ncbi:hypothetical protein PN836_007020 [Ningiella sp. W23]|uniref:hypothetical protein n=1 Tax=Ningiella sp. W23 TaxID=3023715 RepID=UPI0037579B9C
MNKQLNFFEDLSSTEQDNHAQLVHQYLELTNVVMPRLAKRQENNWPVKHNHCFARIVLDNVCQDLWYAHIKAPAYLHLSTEQAEAAVRICKEIIEGKADIHALNTRSLAYRAKASAPRQ